MLGDLNLVVMAVNFMLFLLLCEIIMMMHVYGMHSYSTTDQIYNVTYFSGFKYDFLVMYKCSKKRFANSLKVSKFSFK